MPYTSEKPTPTPDRSDLRRRINGWGADLDPKDRPAIPKERLDPAATRAAPERQAPRAGREKSTEHPTLTPVFGTACPLKGLSGVIRRFAYTYSEGRMAHWLLLALGDRVDVVESDLGDLLRLRPPRRLKEMGLRAELDRHGIRSRFGRGRADTWRLPVDLLLLAAPSLARGALIYAATWAVRRAPRRAWT